MIDQQPFGSVDEEKEERINEKEVEPEEIMDAGTSDGAGLSKRALKKLKKRQEWLDNKHERRRKEKEKRKMKMAARKLEKDYEETRTAS